MQEMLTEINVLRRGSVRSSDSTTSPLDARGVILENRGRIRLRKPEFLKAPSVDTS